MISKVPPNCTMEVWNPWIMIKIPLYTGDPALPVYRWGLKNGRCSDDVVELLINRCIEPLTNCYARLNECRKQHCFSIGHIEDLRKRRPEMQ